jgi:acetyl-CoA carboxylase biotin carboxylase subunit
VPSAVFQYLPAVGIGLPPSKESYLNIPALLTAAALTHADAIHPGLGFLSENAKFAQMVVEHGFTWIGPKPEHINMMGDKIIAKKTAKDLGIPVVPGSDGEVRDEEHALEIANEIGYPVLLKATAGGGGKGMKVARNDGEMKEALSLAKAEAKNAFNNASMYMEKYLDHPRHIEIQILGDKHGNVVHLGERDCSLQRRHQKVIEEAPSPALNAEARKKIGDVAVKAMKKLGYESLGTIEFLYQDGEFYFIEMNTRVQVEHPVTEMITGVDLVREQIRVADNAPLSFTQKQIEFVGHSIECRINAENPVTFTPSPGKVTDYHAPGGLGVRVDSALYSGYKVPPTYDSMISKLIVHGKSRNECLLRLRRALEEYVIGGITTNIPLHEQLIAAPDFIDGNYDIHWLEKFVTAEQAKRDKEAA